MKKILFSILILALFLFNACTKKEAVVKSEPKKVTVILDWVPNTNHTGLYAALELGYFKAESLDVKIMQPAEGGALGMTAAGQGDFCISFQEEISFARTAESPLPIKAVAAIIQHNTSGFAFPKALKINSPKDFAGKTFGGWGSPAEKAVLEAVMKKDGGDFSKLKIVELGTADFFSAIRNGIDIQSIFFGWTGLEAQIRNTEIGYLEAKTLDARLDYYTPLIAANEKLLSTDPAMVKKFLKAVSAGYTFASQNPDSAVKFLLKNAPETNPELALASQRFLAKEYQADAAKWGVMEKSRWDNYAQFLTEYGLISKPFDSGAAFTNDFLP